MDKKETRQQKPKKKTRQQCDQRVKVEVVEGKARLELFSQWIDGQLDWIEAAREGLRKEIMNVIVAKTGKRTSHAQWSKMKLYNNASVQQAKPTKIEPSLQFVWPM